MEIKLSLGGRRRSPVTVAVYCLLATVLLLLLLTDATAASPSTKAAVSPGDINAAAAATRRGSSPRWLWQHGHHGPAAARRLLVAVQPASTAMVGKDTNEFHVEGVRRPAKGKLAREIGFDAGRRIPSSGSNRNHN